MHVYIHIPFCKQACHYCDFHFSTNLSYKERMVQALSKEIESRAAYLSEKTLETVYFGGGSPSILSPKELETIFTALHSCFDLSQVKEITLEANPDDITNERLNEWYSSGVNRLSLGIQTFNEVFLKFMNRAHSSSEAIRALELVLNKGFETSSADLIYAKTGLHLDTKRQATLLREDIRILSSFNLQHISAYNLTIEEETVFGKWASKNKLAEIPDEYAAEQYGIVVDELGNMGFEQYEISNFARNKKYAVHNTSYWMGHEYLGIGPSAHSFNKESRQWNVSNNHHYMAAIESDELNFELEKLSVSDRVNDYLMTGLRTIWGVSLKEISRISADIPSGFRDTIEELKAQNLLVQNNEQLIIPSEARILSDRIASDLFWI